MSERLGGLVAAVFTPMDEGGEIAFERIAGYAALLAANGLAGVFVAGTTGEGMSLSIEERKRLAEAWVEAAPPPLRVIVHVGHTCLGECRALAAHAAECGARGIGALAPFFYRPAAVEDLVDWCAAIAAAAPRLPFYYYHMPAMSGVELPMVEFLSQAAARIPNLAGMKYTDEDLEEFCACRRLGDGRFDVLFGRDQMLLSAVRKGAGGAIGSTYNFAAPLYHAILRAHQEGDGARGEALQAEACAMIEACQAAGTAELPALKAAMNILGVPCGPVRPPLRNLTAEECDRLRAALYALGMEQWRCRPPGAGAAQTSNEEFGARG